uniref:Biogenesis of lysosome-related organelles complex 1 subunit 1 n=1 Tax=Panagrellus redivivus TaxID=6233 RepID=A0A7E4VXV1_PANRE
MGVIEGLIDKLSNGFSAKQADLERYLRLTTEMQDTFDAVRSVLSQLANWVAALYVKLGHVWTRILKNGLVNAIPKEEEDESGQGRDIDNVGGENCGMGDGEGSKDVGAEMEETGQVDDLRDDNEEEGPQDDQPQEKQKDSETPLEMEDDFAADLESRRPGRGQERRQG